MAHFAKIVNGIVEDVIVIEPEDLNDYLDNNLLHQIDPGNGFKLLIIQEVVFIMTHQLANLVQTNLSHFVEILLVKDFTMMKI